MCVYGKNSLDIYVCASLCRVPIEIHRFVEGKLYMYMYICTYVCVQEKKNSYIFVGYM